VAVGLMTATALTPAWGAGSSSEGYDTAYAGSGYQYAAWSKSNKNLRLASGPNTSMPTTKCMDAMLDWYTTQPHYDSRVVRSCLPGYTEETDPCCGGYWSEIDSAFSYVSRTSKGYGYMIEDGSLTVSGSPDHFDNAGAGTLWTTAPATGTQGYSRIGTRYQNGSVLSCNPTPASSAAGSGGCS
jgi:hypothetical protein